ncbi:Uma2 family endonuclease [Endothiovibrio diazotrophicus]
MPQAATQKISRDDYLAMEEQSPIRHQFLAGEVFAMTGGTFNHAAIAGNILSALSRRAAGKPCRPMNSDMRVHTPSGLDTYPDVSVFCGKPELTDDQRTLLNPAVIFEVLSPSTRTYDRGDKFVHYRSITSLLDYVLVDSETLAVEHFRRSPDGREWVLHEYREPTDTLPLPAIEAELPLAEIYQEIELSGGA